MRTLILAVAGAVSLTSLAQNSPRLWTGDVPPAVHEPEETILPPRTLVEIDPAYIQYATLNLDDAADAYAIYKCVLTNDIVNRYLPYLVYDLGWGTDITRRFIYALVYIESRLNPYDVVENEPGNPKKNANGILQVTQVMPDERFRISGIASFHANELADRTRPPEETYLRSLTLLNDMAREARWNTPEEIVSWWYCWKCTDSAVRNWRIGNATAAYYAMDELEWDGIACSFRCNTEPFRTIEP